MKDTLNSLPQFAEALRFLRRSLRSTQRQLSTSLDASRSSLGQAADSGRTRRRAGPAVATRRVRATGGVHP